MIRVSKFIFTAFFILLGVFNSANAADAQSIAKTKNIEAVGAVDISLLNLNVFAWSIFNYQTNTGPAGVIASYINIQKFDFITTQEFQDGAAWNGYGGPWGYLTNHGDHVRFDPTKGKDVRDANYGLDPKYRMVVAPADPILYYDSSKWTFNNYASIPMTGDIGPRTAVFATFTRTDGSGKSVVVATTHLCVAYNGADCVGGQYTAHLNDSIKLAAYIKNNYSSSTPVILTGDFNSLDNPVNQGLDIKTKLAAANLNPVIDNNTKTFVGPTFGGNTIDFVYYNNLNVVNSSLYSGSASDHKGIRVDFTFGTPVPPVTCDNAPILADIISNYSPPPSPPTKDNPFGVVNIDVKNSSYDNIKGVEIWDWNAQNMIASTITSKELSINNKLDSASSVYGYQIKNLCENGAYSSFTKLDVPAK